MAIFGGFGVIIFLISFLFSGEHIAKEIIDEMEDFFDDVKELLFEDILENIVNLIIMIIIAVSSLFMKKDKLLEFLEDKNFSKVIRQGKLLNKLTDEEIIANHSKINGRALYNRIGISNVALMRQITKNDDYWKIVSKNPSLEVLQEFHKLINWDRYQTYQALPDNVIKEFHYYLDWSKIEKQSFSEEVFFEFSNRIRFGYIDQKKNPWVREANRSDKLKLFLSYQDI